MGNPCKKLLVIPHFPSRMVRLPTRESHACFSRLAALLIALSERLPFLSSLLNINKIRHSVYLVRSFDFCCLQAHRSHGTLPGNKQTFKFKTKINRIKQFQSFPLLTSQKNSSAKLLAKKATAATHTSILKQAHNLLVLLTTPENTITHHNALCCHPKILHKHCFQFPSGPF